MVSKCRKYSITYNGEIYNFKFKKIFRSKGNIFQTDSDTEVILNGINILELHFLIN